jgi:biopolymer transport protein ExbD
MSDVQDRNETALEEDLGPVLPRRPVMDSAEMDITPMIDITFLLLIFFLVCSTMDQQTAVKLPPARHGSGVDERSSVIITVEPRGAGVPPAVYMGDGTSGTPLDDDHTAQEEMIIAEVEQGLLQGKPNVLIKAAMGVKHGEVSRVAAAAASVEGIRLHMAVFEIR